MELLYWLLFVIIGYSYAGYPLVIFVLSLFINNKIEKRAHEPKVTFLITAYNEERYLKEKLENTISLDYPRDRLEIMVASDGSDDGTDEIAGRFADKGVVLFRMEGRVGKTETQNQAVRIATGEIVIFSDATTMYDALSVRNIVRNFADARVGAVSGKFYYVDPKKTLIGTGTSLFWDYESFIKSRQTQIHTITGCSGCIYAVRKDLYVPLPYDIISDLVEPLKILEKGYKVVFEPEAFAYEMPFKESGDEFKMRTRVILRGMRGLLYMRQLFNPLRYGFVSFQLISHKILRWFVPFFAAAMFIVNVFLLDRSRWYLFLFLFQYTFYVAAIVGWYSEFFRKRTKIFSVPFYFCVVNAASVAALIRLFRRKKEIRWQTVRP